jgi:hypothetical protein
MAPGPKPSADHMDLRGCASSDRMANVRFAGMLFAEPAVRRLTENRGVAGSIPALAMTRTGTASRLRA